MKVQISMKCLILAAGMMACLQTNSAMAQAENSSKTGGQEAAKGFISIFEIPASDLSRAVKFYQSILDVKIEIIEMSGMKMGLFPSEGREVSGVITQGEGYKPSTDGVLVYLNGGDNLTPMLNKVIKNGGKVVVSKTLIDAENGYFALFVDTEGNRVGIHSPN